MVLSFAALLITVLEQENRCRKQSKQTKRFLCCGADSRSGSSRQLWEEIFVCLTVPSYHTAVPGAYSTKIGWILPLSENEIKLNFNCLWAIFIMELQPLQIYSERSKSSAHLLARYVFHSHLSLLWDTSGASIANVWLYVEKKHHDPRKNDLCKTGRLIKGEQQVITKTVTNYKTSNNNS